jgi:hypothetical protein
LEIARLTSVPLSDEEVDARWKWFRDCVMTIHGPPPLPKVLDLSKAELSANDRVEEDDIRYDMVPAEFNYTWRHWTLRFGDVTAEIERSDYGEYISFKLGEGGNLVRCHIARHAAFLEIDDALPEFAAWEREAAKVR